MVDETGLLERSLMYDARFGPLKFKCKFGLGKLVIVIVLLHRN